eukprot:CFRG3719T1
MLSCRSFSLVFLVLIGEGLVGGERVCYSAEETCTIGASCQIIDPNTNLCSAGIFNTYSKLFKTADESYRIEIYADPLCAVTLLVADAETNNCTDIAIPILGSVYFQVSELAQPNSTTTTVGIPSTTVTFTSAVSSTPVESTAVQSNPDGSLAENEGSPNSSSFLVHDFISCFLGGISSFIILGLVIP